MRAPAIPTQSIPRTTVNLWHHRLVTLHVALSATIRTIPGDGEHEALHSTLDLCAAELARINLALETVTMEWDVEADNRHAAACRSEGLLP